MYGHQTVTVVHLTVHPKDLHGNALSLEAAQNE
jgi:hypothetical protein